MSVDPGPVDDVLRRLRALAERLATAAADTRRAGSGLDRCWSDDLGRGWVERVGLLSRQLGRDAEACAALANRVARAFGGSSGPDEGDEPVVGPLLGSTAGRRVDNARGMRIATLSDEESLPSDGR